MPFCPPNGGGAGIGYASLLKINQGCKCILGKIKGEMVVGSNLIPGYISSFSTLSCIFCTLKDTKLECMLNLLLPENFDNEIHLSHFSLFNSIE